MERAQYPNQYDSEWRSTRNPIAERVNGILKTEFLAHMRIPDKLDKAQQVIEDIIHTYNHYRPHMSLEWNTPAQIYESEGGKLIRQWHNYQSYKEKNLNEKTILQESTSDIEKL